MKILGIVLESQSHFLMCNISRKRRIRKFLNGNPKQVFLLITWYFAVWVYVLVIAINLCSLFNCVSFIVLLKGHFFVIFISVMEYWWKEMETRKSRTYCRLAFRQAYLWRILSLSLKWGWTFSCSWICGKRSRVFSCLFVVVWSSFLCNFFSLF